MSEMTLVDRLRKAETELVQAVGACYPLTVIREAIAHLTRAPGQVTDEDVERIIAKVTRETSMDGMDGDTWDRLLVRESLSARLAQPVVAKVPDDWAIDISGGQRSFGVNAQNDSPLWHTDNYGLLWISNTYHRTPKELLAECESTAKELRTLLSQPHPQAAQGELSGNSGVLDGPKTDREMLVYIDQQLDFQVWNCPRCGWDEPTKEMDIAGEIREYLATHPAERAAVPEGWVLVPRIPTQAMCDAFMKEEDEADYSGGPREIIIHDVWRAVLTAAPALAGKEG